VRRGNTSTSPTSPDVARTSPASSGRSSLRRVEVVALDGASFAASLNDSDYLSAHHEQYSEFMGNRSFYKDGWKLAHVASAEYALRRPGVGAL